MLMVLSFDLVEDAYYAIKAIRLDVTGAGKQVSIQVVDSN